jgi:hypothetical protein
MHLDAHLDAAQCGLIIFSQNDMGKALIVHTWNSIVPLDQ